MFLKTRPKSETPAARKRRRTEDDDNEDVDGISQVRATVTPIASDGNDTSMIDGDLPDEVNDIIFNVEVDDEVEDGPDWMFEEGEKASRDPTYVFAPLCIESRFSTYTPSTPVNTRSSQNGWEQSLHPRKYEYAPSLKCISSATDVNCEKCGLTCGTAGTAEMEVVGPQHLALHFAVAHDHGYRELLAAAQARVLAQPCPSPRRSPDLDSRHKRHSAIPDTRRQT